MRMILVGLVLLASAAQAQTSFNCKSDKGAVSAVYEGNSYSVAYNFGDDDQGVYKAQLLTAGSSDYTFEEIATAGEGVATFFVYKTADGFVGEFGGKGVLPQTFAPGQCVLAD